MLKGLAEYFDISLGELIEGVSLHALEGKTPFESRTLDVIGDLRKVYGLSLTAADSHQLADSAADRDV